MNMTAVTASNVMLQLFCNFATQKMFTASNCVTEFKNHKKKSHFTTNSYVITKAIPQDTFAKKVSFVKKSTWQMCSFSSYEIKNVSRVRVKYILFRFLNTFTLAFLQ